MMGKRKQPMLLHALRTDQALLLEALDVLRELDRRIDQARRDVARYQPMRLHLERVVEAFVGRTIVSDEDDLRD
jgi:hypothetical protein